MAEFQCGLVEAYVVVAARAALSELKKSAQILQFYSLVL